MKGEKGAGRLVPISEVCRRFGMRASALRYYDEIALLKPAERRGGRRCYGVDELRKLALIHLWQETGKLSLEDIAAMLSDPMGQRGWRDILQEQIKALDTQIRAAEAAKAYLDHKLNCPRSNIFDGCPILNQELRDCMELAERNAAPPASRRRNGPPTRHPSRAAARRRHSDHPAPV